MIRGAADGKPAEREEFARRYGPLVRAYLVARWRGGVLGGEIEDAVQEVFLECFRDGGVLDHVDPSCARGFRAFLFGVVRNVAMRAESRRQRKREIQPSTSFAGDLEGAEETPSHVFDRLWAYTLMRQTAEKHAARAREVGEAAVQRVELLRLRFEEGLEIHQIAERWGLEPWRVQKDYARARAEFREVLLEVVSFHHPGTPGEIARECENLKLLLRGI